MFNRFFKTRSALIALGLATGTALFGFEANSAGLSDRAAEDVLNNTVNVKKFGAVCDGVTNDTAAFAAALSATSGYVFVPDGTCLLSAAPSSAAQNRLYGLGVLKVSGVLRGLDLRAGLSTPDSNNDITGGFVVGGLGPGKDGTIWKSGANPAWSKFKATKRGSPTQVQIYPNALMGIAYPSANNQLTATNGTFDATYIKSGDRLWWNGAAYTVDRVVSNSVLRVKGAPFTIDAHNRKSWAHVYHYAVGKCDTNGVAINWVSGDTFHSDSTLDNININGVNYSISHRKDKKHIILSSSAGAQSNVDFIYKTHPSFEYLSLFRVQGLWGRNEEDFVIAVKPDKTVNLETQFAGDGDYLPIKIRTGPADDGGALRDALTITDNGNLQINGTIAHSGAKVEINQRVATASGGPPDELELLRLHATFAGTNARWLEFVAKNNWSVPYMQGRQSGGSVSDLRLNPLGGGVVIGSESPKPSNAALWVVGNDIVLQAGKSYTFGNNVKWTSGSGSPEGVVTAPVGSFYSRTDGGPGTTMYVKESGAGNTGWAAK